MKKYIIIAGVNGAGKSTLFSLVNSWSAIEKVNLDELVRKNGDWRNTRDLLYAGRIAVQKINDCLKNDISFCQETTLCGNTVLKNIDKAKKLGYEVEVHYVGVDSVEIAKERVAHRVKIGGHGIPEEDIERRYKESFEKLQQVINICDLVVLYDNTTVIKRFAIYKKGTLMRCSDKVPEWYMSWKKILENKQDFLILIEGSPIYIETNSCKLYKKFLERCGLYYDRLFDWEKWEECEIMHGSDRIASICRNGTCTIYEPEIMPYNLYLEMESEEDVDLRIQNLENFYHWCSSRMLPSEREFSKEIWNSMGKTPPLNDKERAKLAMSYYCLSLTDIYWIKRPEQITKMDFAKINLFENFLNSKYMDITLRGKRIAVEEPQMLRDNLSTGGCLPKAWVWKEDGLYLLKSGKESEVKNELLASKICQCFNVNQVVYEECSYNGELMSACRIMTSLEYSIVPMEYYEIYLMNKGIDKMQRILEVDAYSYYMMNIVDYLIGNTDRHWGNWGVLVDNTTNEPIRLHDLMDFNKAFEAYDTIDGANCLTCLRMSEHKTQKEAAIEAVRKIGLNQITEVKAEWFADESVREMFFRRLEVLRVVASCGW